MTTNLETGGSVSVQQSEFRFRGKSFTVPMRRIEGHEVIAVGRWLRIATLNDEEWLEGDLVGDPTRFVDALQTSGLPADIFSYSGPLDGLPSSWSHFFELDNTAVIRTDDYKAWWDGLSQDTRRNARRAVKKGIEVRTAIFNAEFVAGIKTIYDETPVRQGRSFWHFGKDTDAVRRENSTYLDRAEFLGAYHGDQLVGFIKFVHVGNTARIMQILCLNGHQDKRPIFALIAKSVEVCNKKGMKYLTYGRFSYGLKTDGGITEFKRRLGFTRSDVPRYYIPLTIRGRIAIKCGLHMGWRALVPPMLVDPLRAIRTWWLKITAQP